MVREVHTKQLKKIKDQNFLKKNVLFVKIVKIGANVIIEFKQADTNKIKRNILTAVDTGKYVEEIRLLYLNY